MRGRVCVCVQLMGGVSLKKTTEGVDLDLCV